jgi:hypothetical protein
MTTPTASILITYRNEPVALVNARHVTFVCEIPAGDPRQQLFVYMARYAQQIAIGERAGPYSDEAASRFARVALIDPGRLEGYRGRSDREVAQYLNLPVEQVMLARGEVASAQAQPRSDD